MTNGFLHNITRKGVIPKGGVILWRPNNIEVDIMAILKNFQVSTDRKIIFSSNFDEIDKYVVHYVAEFMNFDHHSTITDIGSQLHVSKPRLYGGDDRTEFYISEDGTNLDASEFGRQLSSRVVKETAHLANQFRKPAIERKITSGTGEVKST